MDSTLLSDEQRLAELLRIWLGKALTARYEPQASDRRARVLIARFCGEEILSLAKVGGQFGVTRERVRIIEATALSRLRRNHLYRDEIRAFASRFPRLYAAIFREDGGGHGKRVSL